MKHAAEGRALRIAFCHHTSDVAGGSDRSLFDIVTHLPRKRFEPAVILRPGDPMAVEYEAAGVEVALVPFVHPRRALELAKLARYFLSFLPSVLRTRAAIRRLNADVVHVNTLNNLQGAFAARLARRPLVWHVREMAGGSLVVRAMLRLVSLLATFAVANSNAVGETLYSCGGRLRVVLNGIDLSEYEEESANGEGQRVKIALALDEDAPVVTTIGRLEPWKGQDVLVEAMPAILAEHPAAKFLIVGGPAVNKPEYEVELKARCRKLGVADSVVFTGIRTDVPAILAASDVLVLPSVTPEPFGRTVVEAMAARRPVVATAEGGPLETVVDGETGWLVAPGDEGALAGKVCRVLAQPDEAREMGVRGRERAVTHFSLARLVDDMAALFEEAGAASGSKQNYGERMDSFL